ncbi:hypothetical protein, partial [Pseudomonas sp. TH03]|uniref:hypothetical protein n=1 Tax=Pseudomonas sp. TH03 TaxID=2796369 RepID=UPI001A92C988
ENSSALPEPETGDTHLLFASNVPVIFPFKAYRGFFQSFYSLWCQLRDGRRVIRYLLSRTTFSTVRCLIAVNGARSAAAFVEVTKHPLALDGFPVLPGIPAD